MSDLSFIHSLPSEFVNYHLVPANNRYPCTWGYTSTKEIYHIVQLIGGGQYLFVVTDTHYNYLGHSDKFEEANKLGQDYPKSDTTQSMYQPFDFDKAVEEMSRELIISKVHQVPAPYQSMYILEQVDGFTGGFVIYAVARVTGKTPEYYLVANTLKNFVDAFITFDEAKQLVLNYQEAASEVQMKVEDTTSSMSQEELQQLKDLLDKAKLVLNSASPAISDNASISILNDRDNELVLIADDIRTEKGCGIRRSISSKGVQDIKITID